ncbi:MAG: pyruvate:ferredoxin (flavodoxin) oxidoreductase [Cyanobacteriota bacterium]|nr:pyruvate:ferredoxin (flavodoxin) oxidoreductase [Cyanobacteriota bacterium]
MTAEVCVDGNEAVARVAYRLSEVIALYPITPATPMGEWADRWRAQQRPNLWGSVPEVVQLQSEAGVAGAVHGALQAGALATTFTASQGLLLMIPNLYRLAGELTPVVVHVAARALAVQALSIFGDQGDVMAARGCGCAVLCSASPQEAGDFAAIAMVTTLRTRVPFLHVFDGFRTSHEIQKLHPLSDTLLQELMPQQAIAAHRRRALSPDHPVLRGAAQNPDVVFQGRETVNPYVEAVPDQLLEVMALFAARTGRRYQPFDYQGAADAERVLVLMGSGCGSAQEAIERLGAAGERVGLLKVRMFRPFAASLFVAALPASTRMVAVLDRCKEPGAAGEPLYLDVVAALAEQWEQHHRGCPLPQVIGGRYGLGSKEFTPAMAAAVLANLQAGPAAINHFTVGIEDDVTHRSLPVDPDFCCEAGVLRAVVYGLGSDGSVGAAKASIRIIGGCSDLQVQGFFVYDSKKAGSRTVSHLRIGPAPIASTYLIQRPTLVACHQWSLLDQMELCTALIQGGVLLLNSPYDASQTWQHLPQGLRRLIVSKQLAVWIVNAYQVSRQAGLGPRINTVMQVCFFAVCQVLPLQQALDQIRRSIQERYGALGEAVVAQNLRAIDASLEALQPLDWQALDGDAAAATTAGAEEPDHAEQLGPLTAFEQQVTLPLIAHQGDRLPVSAIPCDGTWPTGTARLEKRNLAEAVPIWHSDLCVQCGKCVMVCPHAAIRAKLAAPQDLLGAPAGFATAPARDPAFAGQQFSIAVAVEDCTGCTICVEVCPAREPQPGGRKALEMQPQLPLREPGRRLWDFFVELPEVPRHAINVRRLGQQQFQQPLFEFSGACAGCGETPYLKLLSQLFGDRLLIANATGCSSIYGGNLPTSPWTTNRDGRGPAWSNSLFEDNAEFGYGMRLTLDYKRHQALQLLQALAAMQPPLLEPPLVRALQQADQGDEAGIAEQRQRVAALKAQLQVALRQPAASTDAAWAMGQLLELADALVHTSVWMVGGDGWAYDIGFGGLDHVLASGRDVNVLVLDTEVYSNTGGQASKATPLGAVAGFATAGKDTPKKDLGLMAITYGHVYVASVAMGARDEHTLRAFLEAESYRGPSLILAYAHCIEHGIAMDQGMAHQRAAVDSGRWMLYRYDPRRRDRGLNPLQLDKPQPKGDLLEAMGREGRFAQLQRSDSHRAQELAARAVAEQQRRWALYRALAGS